MRSITIAVAQFQYKPSLYLGEVDYIVEPFGDEPANFSRASFSGAKKLREKFKNDYFDWLRVKIINILECLSKKLDSPNFELWKVKRDHRAVVASNK